MINPQIIRQTLEIFKGTDENGLPIKNKIIEIRIHSAKNKNENYSGYYTLETIDKLLLDIQVHTDKNIYFVLNDINPSCYAKQQKDCLMKNVESTKDNEIVSRDWLFIDFDCKRPSQISSTDDEKKLAWNKLFEVASYLSSMGFHKPIIADSGNGWHLYYRILLSNEINKEVDKAAENTAFMKDFLNALSGKFSDENVDIDTKVFNAGRITKLFGTTAVKGANTENRPHRLSYLYRIPKDIIITPKATIQKVIDELLPKTEKPTFKNNWNTPPFNIDEFILKHNIQIEKEVTISAGRKLLLKECPFCGNKSPDSCLFVSDNGAVSFYCFHNSCANKTWRDFRLYFDPNAYERIYENPHRTNRPYTPEKPKMNIITEEKGAIWKKFSEIKDKDRSMIVSIPSGFDILDRKTYGFDKKTVNIWTGVNGCGKSSILNQVILNGINVGFKGRIWTGELGEDKLKRWLYKQAAGRNFTIQSEYNEDDYYVPKHIIEKIDTWTDDKIKNYNIKYDNDFSLILDEVRNEYQREPFDFLILDNLMALDIDTFAGDKNDKQTKCIWELHYLAEKLDIVIHIVMHPRKEFGLTRSTDISGSGNLRNAADNIFIVHRVTNRDFIRLAPEVLGKHKVESLISSGATNIIECAKHREFGGFIGEIIELFYQKESGRFLSYPNHHWEYGWNIASNSEQLRASFVPMPEPILLKPNVDFDTDISDLLALEPTDECPF